MTGVPDRSGSSRPATRYASVDLLRGVSIVVMLVLHALMDTLDSEYYISRLETGGLINIVALIILPLLGGMAGLFLLTSAIGNMLGMSRNLQKGHAPYAVMRKQILGGVTIVLFAMVAEAVFGYHGALGQFMLNLDDLGSTDYSPMYYRAYNIETLHTIGYAEILNGITHGVIASRFDVAKHTAKVIRIYWMLAALVVALTPLVWWLSSWMMPGYPFAINPVTGQPMYLAVIGTSPPQDLITYFLVNPLAAPVEPLFPYLATSYVGSIIGLQIARNPESFDRSFIRRYFAVGMVCFVVGAVGFSLLLLNLMREGSLEEMILQYRRIFDHRFHTTENKMPGGWFWQYLTLSGATLMIATLSFRLVEFRGKGKVVADRLAFIRRFGFIAFTIYTVQWVYFIMHFLVSIAMGLEPYTPLHWLGTWAVVAFSLLALDGLMRIWEKVDYIGSIEWAIISINNRLSGIEKQVSADGATAKWYQQGRLNVAGVFYGPQWKNLDAWNTPSDERRLIWYSSIAGIVVFPFSLIAFALIRAYQRDHPEQRLVVPKLISIFGIALMLIALTCSFVFSLQDIGGCRVDQGFAGSACRPGRTRCFTGPNSLAAASGFRSYLR